MLPVNHNNHQGLTVTLSSLQNTSIITRVHSMCATALQTKLIRRHWAQLVLLKNLSLIKTVFVYKKSLYAISYVFHTKF